jgi:hypothetical protein
VLFFLLYSIEPSLSKTANVLLRDFPVAFIRRFVKELRGLLSYVYLLQSAIHHWSQLHPIAENPVVYRGIPRLGQNLEPLYLHVIDEIILWRGFTSTSRRIKTAVRNSAKDRSGVLFEITLHSGCSASDISSVSAHRESEV